MEQVLEHVAAICAMHRSHWTCEGCPFWTQGAKDFIDYCYFDKSPCAWEWKKIMEILEELEND